MVDLASSISSSNQNSIALIDKKYEPEKSSFKENDSERNDI